MKNCTANVCINKGRVKTYGDKVYLSDGQEYSIELFNGTRTKKMAKIYLDGKLISTSGLVLKPGQRAFLERFIDDSRKFKFSTYKVDDSKEVRDAIQENGDLKIEFYDEENVNITYTYSNTYSNGWSPYDRKDFIITSTNNPVYVERSSSYSTSCYLVDDCNNLETGNTEKGSVSNQNFGKSYDNFNTWAYKIVTYKILPLSHKPIEIQDTLLYCTKCSNKQKKDQRYCPKCGTKYE